MKMKKKHRAIRVDGVKYGWTLHTFGKECHVYIWKDKRKIHHEGMRVATVTPGMVADIIKENKL